MRSKQSYTASGINSRSGSFTPPMPILTAALTLPSVATVGDDFSLPGHRQARPDLGVTQEEGLLHDARNLMGALGLYCDLLSRPGVLKPEHRHYAEELRLMETRSGALMERLMLASATPAAEVLRGGAGWEAGAQSCSSLTGVRTHGVGYAEPPRMPVSPVRPVSLRVVVERCSGLLSRVAGGRTIEVSYGPAASLPALVGEEAVERILVNLVRNAAVALDGLPEVAAVGDDAFGDAALSTVRETVPDPTSDETPGTIRIGVGLLANRVGDPEPWPFRRVRLTVEDSGCGMAPEQLERVLSAGRAPGRGSHGIGFRVVRELVAAWDGHLRVMSAPGIGTRVQIEWPLAGMTCMKETESGDAPDGAIVTGRCEGSPAAGAGGSEYLREALFAREISRSAEAEPTLEASSRSRRLDDSQAGSRGWLSC